MRCTHVGLSALAVAAAAPRANATIYNLYVFENVGGVDASQLDLWVDVIDGGSYVDFEFHNDSVANSFITSIYVEEAGTLSGGSIVFESAGVDFSDGATRRTRPARSATGAEARTRWVRTPPGPSTASTAAQTNS